MHNSPVPCFKCGGPLQVDDDSHVISNGMSFRSRGGYGSFYDPVGRQDRHWLRIHVCDNCVRQGARDGTVVEATRIPKPDDITYHKFDPDEDKYY